MFFFHFLGLLAFGNANNKKPAFCLIIAHSVLCFFSRCAAREYLGIPLGSLRNASLGTSGQVWLANSTAIQISDFSIESHQSKQKEKRDASSIASVFAPSEQELTFAFVSTEDEVEPVKFLYKVVAGTAGDVLVPV